MLTPPDPTSPDEPTPLPLLADPATYRACPWDLSRMTRERVYWLGLFRRHFPTLIDHAVEEGVDRGETDAVVRQRCDRAWRAFEAYLDRQESITPADGPLDILTICRQRERALRAAGIADPYRRAKQRENQAALQLLPSVLAELDALDDPSRAARLIEGVFAGNIFDLGATSCLDLYRQGRSGFVDTRQGLKPRPWAVDDLDPWLARWRSRPHRSALLFVDNAGSDVILGMIPWAREMLRRGTRVTLTANTHPTLNDVTIDELRSILDAAASIDAILARSLADGSLQTVASGNDVPLIDLSRVSDELISAVGRRGVDLVVLEGMGRAIESNYHARMTCDCVKLAMVKDRGVAEAMGWRLYDLVFRYEPAERSLAPQA